MTAIGNRLLWNGQGRGRLCPRRTAWPGIAAPGGAALILAGLLAATAVHAQTGSGYFVPGDPKAGMQVFFDKGCTRCHALFGEGGRSAPDLARAPAGHLSAAELVAAMWNHAPAMWERMRVEKIAFPKFTNPEMTNLFAFLYSVRSLDEPGDPEHGRQLFAEKKCLECHAIAGEGGRTGPDLRMWARARNPVSWVQAMWNHGAAMQAMMAQRRLTWPQFRGADMVDLIAYVRSRTAASRPRAQLRQANAENGRRVFEQKSCGVCHGARRAVHAGVPNLRARELPRTLGQFAGVMWNHAPAMWDSMRARGLARPQFSNQEMADLIAYLFTQRYFDPEGSAVRGRTTFDDRGCAVCHAAGRAPSLARFRSAASPVPVATALWNHGPLMLAKMQKQRFAWPRFQPGEMVDLLEFLNRGGAPDQILRADGGKR